MIVLKEQDIYRGYKNKRYADKAIEFLTKRHLLPLTGFSSLSNLVGHLMGDGTLSKDKFVGDFRFYGSKEKLEYIKNIVFNIFEIYPKSFIKRKGGFVLRYNNCIVSRFLNLIGVPRGNKVTTSFGVPLWIKGGNRNIKKAFLVAISDDELSSPRIDKRGNLEPLRLKFNKTENLLLIGIQFLEDIRRLFITLGINCSSVKLNNDKYLNLNNQINRSIYFNISAKRENILKFKEKVGFGAERDKIDKLYFVLNDH